MLGVEIDVSNPLVLRFFLSFPEEFDYLEFLYEDFGLFCFCFGTLGHCLFGFTILLNSQLERKVAALQEAVST